MKKLLVWITAFALLSMTAMQAKAFQNTSFTNVSTAGMFDDIYDYFQTSPAYMPGFAKNALWSQLSNLQSQNDYLFAPTGMMIPTTPYFIAGQYDTGFGHVGVAFDFMHSSSPQGNQFFLEPGSHQGFGEGTIEQYMDLSGDGIMDTRRELYGQSDATYKSSTGNLELAYALGGVAGMDLGAAINGYWADYSPNYDYSNTFYDNYLAYNIYEFDWKAGINEYDLINNRPISSFNGEAGGSWSYGYNHWGLTLSGRAKGLVPGLDLVLNVTPSLVQNYNKMNMTYSSLLNNAPADPTVVSTYSQSEQKTGAEIGDWFNPSYQPTSGFQINVNVRADCDLLPGLKMTTWLGFLNDSEKYTDGKMTFSSSTETRTSVNNGLFPAIQDTANSNNYQLVWDGTTGYTDGNAQVRFQVPLQGWRFGFGIGGSFETAKTSQTRTFTEEQRTRYDFGTGDPTLNYTTVTNWAEKYKYNHDSVYNTITLPIGVVIDVMNNFSLQMGASHIIRFYSWTNTTQITDSSIPTTVTTYDDGYVTGGLVTTTWTSYMNNGFRLQNNSNLLVDQWTNYYFGVSWKPFEQVQLDLTDIYSVVDPGQFRVSMSLYF